MAPARWARVAVTAGALAAVACSPALARHRDSVRSGVGIESFSAWSSTAEQAYHSDGSVGAFRGHETVRACLYNRTVTLHAVTATADLVVGTVTSTHGPTRSEGDWEVDTRIPAGTVQIYAGLQRSARKTVICRGDVSDRLTAVS